MYFALIFCGNLCWKIKKKQFDFLEMHHKERWYSVANACSRRDDDKQALNKKEWKF